MKKSYSFIFLLLYMLISTTIVSAEENKMQELLSVAKFAGACGILKSMSSFQNTTKMTGGDEFIQRYWSTEAARLGKTPEQYIDNCNKYISLYKKYWEASNVK